MKFHYLHWICHAVMLCAILGAGIVTSNENEDEYLTQKGIIREYIRIHEWVIVAP